MNAKYTCFSCHSILHYSPLSNYFNDYDTLYTCLMCKKIDLFINTTENIIVHYDFQINIDGNKNYLRANKRNNYTQLVYEPKLLINYFIPIELSEQPNPYPVVQKLLTLKTFI